MRSYKRLVGSAASIKATNFRRQKGDSGTNLNPLFYSFTAQDRSRSGLAAVVAVVIGKVSSSSAGSQSRQNSIERASVFRLARALDLLIVAIDGALVLLDLLLIGLILLLFLALHIVAHQRAGP
jgi:hypothetical protein